MSEKMTDVEAFTLGALVGAAAAGRVSPNGLRLLLKAEVPDLLADAAPGSDPARLAEKLIAAAPVEYRQADPPRTTGSERPSGGDRSFYDQQRQEQRKLFEPPKSGTTGIDRLTGRTGV